MILGHLVDESGGLDFSVSSEQIPERDWREKQKVMDDLMGTVELQRKDLDSLKKDINAKEKLCSALRVSMLTVSYSCGYHRIVLRF